MEVLNKRFDWLLVAVPAVICIYLFYGFGAGLVAFALIAVISFAKPLSVEFSRPWMQVVFATGVVLALSVIFRSVFTDAFCLIHYAPVIDAAGDIDGLSSRAVGGFITGELIERCEESPWGFSSFAGDFSDFVADTSSPAFKSAFRDIVAPLVGIGLAIYAYINRDREVSL